MRTTERITWHLESGETLDSIAQYFVSKNIHPSDVVVENSYDTYNDYDDGEFYFVATCPESDESFSARVAEYERKMQAYHNWYEDNRGLIERELERRRLATEEKKKKDEEKAVKRLKRAKIIAARQLAKIEEQLKDMKE